MTDLPALLPDVDYPLSLEAERLAGNLLISLLPPGRALTLTRTSHGS
jgi:hypothetical protein